MKSIKGWVFRGDLLDKPDKSWLSQVRSSEFGVHSSQFEKFCTSLTYLRKAIFTQTIEIMGNLGYRVHTTFY